MRTEVTVSSHAAVHIKNKLREAAKFIAIPGFSNIDPSTTPGSTKNLHGGFCTSTPLLHVWETLEEIASLHKCFCKVFRHFHNREDERGDEIGD